MPQPAKTRAVDRHEFRSYARKAEEHHAAMVFCHGREMWNACVVNAIHCAISSADALTVFYLGFRSSGERHHDVLSLLEKLGIGHKEISSKSQQLASLLSIKNAAEYEERLMDRHDAESAMKACERFYDWAKGKLK